MTITTCPRCTKIVDKEGAHTCTPKESYVDVYENPTLEPDFLDGWDED